MRLFLWFRKWVEDNTVKASKVSYYALAKKKKKKEFYCEWEVFPYSFGVNFGSLSLFFWC